MSERPKKPLIPGRVMLIGDEGIPRQILEALQDFHLQIFMREPDPSSWPPEMAHLVHYLSAGERFAFSLSEALARHEAQLNEALDGWFSAVWHDLSSTLSVPQQEHSAVLEQLVGHVRVRLEQLLALEK